MNTDSEGMNKNTDAAWLARALGLALLTLTLGAASAEAQTMRRSARPAPRTIRVTHPGVIRAEPNSERVLPSTDVNTPADTSTKPVSGATAQPCMANGKIVECSPEVLAARYNAEFSRLNNIPPSRSSAIPLMEYFKALVEKNPGHFKTPADTTTSRVPGEAAQQQPVPPPCVDSPEVCEARAFNAEFSRLNGIPPSRTSDIPLMEYFKVMLRNSPQHYKRPGASLPSDPLPCSWRYLSGFGPVPPVPATSCSNSNSGQVTGSPGWEYTCVCQ